MKIKKFGNIWTMGLIIFGSLLAILYLAKLLFPSFVVEVAELPRIVQFGEWVDSHWWSYDIFNGLTSFFILYLYCCACCRVRKLDYCECCAIVASIIMSVLVQDFWQNFFVYYNFMVYVFLPMLIVFKRKIKDVSVFYSTCACFLITTLAQCVSLEIRGIYSVVSYPNTATYIVLLIDLYIWSVLLYLFFNNKKEV